MSALRIYSLINKHIRRATALLVLIALIIAQTGCGKSASSAEPVSGEEFMLDTICTVSIYEMRTDGNESAPATDDKEAAETVIKEAFALCSELEDTLSRTRENSDIAKLNSAGGEWVKVSAETLELIKKGIDYSELSGGAFDITIGGVTELWDFHAAEGEEKLPDENALAEAAKHIDFRNIEVDEEGSRVRLTDPDTKIDLGGIAKGYIGDKMSTLLEESAVTSGIINLGGNVICIGAKSDEEDFVIGVEAPFSNHSEIIGKVRVKNKTLVTSGVYERKMEIDGKIYHHILNTDTGWPVETDLDSVTLIADKGRSADVDALSTVCLIKGSAEARALIESTEGIEGIFVLSSGEIQTTTNAIMETVK